MLNEENNEPNIESQNDIDINNSNERIRPVIVKDSTSLKLWKKIVLFAAGCIGIYLFSLIASLIVSTFGLGSKEERSGAVTFITYALMIGALFGILNKDILRLLKDRKWPSILLGLAFGAAMITFPIFYNMVVSLFRTPEINENESSLRSFIVIYPLSSLLILGFVGPICEELTYRVGLFNIFRKWKWAAYLVSISVFALMHFSFDSADIITELINLPVYLFSGFILALAYDKFGFWCSLGAHITNNVYSVVMVILVFYLQPLLESGM